MNGCISPGVLRRLVLSALMIAPIAHGGVPAAAGALEPLYGFRWSDDEAPSVSFAVKSTGCTTAQGFELQLEDSELSLLRREVDRCRRKASIIEVTLPLAPGVKLDRPLRIANPVFLPRRSVQ